MVAFGQSEVRMSTEVKKLFLSLGVLIFVVFGIGLEFDLLRPLRTATDVDEYPQLVEACRSASPETQLKMLQLVHISSSRTALLNFTRHERRTFLQLGGYCGHIFESRGCRELPTGTVAIGFAVNYFSFFCMNPESES